MIVAEGTRALEPPDHTNSLEQYFPILPQLIEFRAIYPDDHYPKKATSLGNAAISHECTLVALRTIEETPDSTRKQIPDRNRYIANERNRIASIPHDERRIIGETIFSEDIPQFLLNILGINNPSEAFERLVQKAEAPDDTYVVPDESVINVLQWHNRQMIETRNKFICFEWPDIKNEFKSKLQKGVDLGWLPAIALTPKKRNAIEGLVVTIDDGMRLYEKGYRAYVDSHIDGYPTRAYFPQNTSTLLVDHELTHVITGSESNNKFGIIKTGLYRMFKRKHVAAANVLNEAVTEHIAHTLNQDSQNPDEILDKISDSTLSSYNEERHVLNALCNSGVRPVDIRLFIRAYVEDSTKLRRPAIRKLKRQITKAFPGRNVLDELGNMMATCSYREVPQKLKTFSESLALAYVHET